MADFDNSFQHAFDHAMLYEVGGFWNSQDPEVQAGLIDTKDQRRKVGYVNIPADRGGETKYGVAQKMNPDVPVRTLDLNGAMQVYFDRYWVAGNCPQLPYPLTIIHFDGCVNHGIGRAKKFLQSAAGVNPDGGIGPNTIAAVNAMDPAQLIQNLSNARAAFYNQIVARDPSQAMFLNGWMRRITEVTNYTLAQL